MVKKRLETPLDLVGIRNRVDNTKKSETPEYWNDEGLARLKDLEQQYTKVREELVLNQFKNYLNIQVLIIRYSSQIF